MQANQDDRITKSEANSDGKGILIAVAALLAVGAMGIYYYLNQPDTPETTVQAPEQTTVQVPDALPEKPIPTETIPEPEPEVTQQKSEPQPEPVAQKTEPVKPTLPQLNQSDEFVHQQTLEAFKGLSINDILLNKNLARQFVVFVDNLAHGELARKSSPLIGPKQHFDALDVTDKIYLDPDSYHRYDMYAELLETMNSKAVISTYRLLTPILNDAFSELGYEDVTFNQRVKKAIKEVLNAPIIEQPIELTSISVNYKFKDADIESLPDAQKLMIRMGPKNTRKVKTALRRILKELP